MPFTLKDVALGGIVPAVVAAFVCWALGKKCRDGTAREFPAALAFVAGFGTGYGLLELGPWKPASHWHWLPYVALVAALSGPLTCASGRYWLRAVLLIVPASIAAWLLVPDWTDLDPSPAVHLSAFTAAAVLLNAATVPLASRVRAPTFAAALCLAAVSTAVLLLLADSLRFAQMAGVTAAAITGCAAAACWRPDESRLGGLAYGSTLTVAALMLVGYVYSFSSVPAASYVLVPATPLMLWFSAAGPLARLRGVRLLAVQVVLLLVPLVLAFWLAAASTTSRAESPPSQATERALEPTRPLSRQHGEQGLSRRQHPNQPRSRSTFFLTCRVHAPGSLVFIEQTATGAARKSVRRSTSSYKTLCWLSKLLVC